MTLRALSLGSLKGRSDFLPHAILKMPVHEAIRSVAAEIEHGSDQFDDFDEAAALMLEDGLPFVILHYKGHPAGTATVYLPPSVTSLDEITHAISVILKNLDISQQALMWQRSDEPEL